MSKKNKATANIQAAYFLRIAGVLTLICSVVALILAGVNLITADKIAENTAEEQRAAIAEIFPEMSDAVLYEGYTENEVYLVLRDGKLYGYCAAVTSQGYGGAIEMMVGVDLSSSVAGVKIISMSETAGVGSKTKNDSFLSQYINKKAPFTVGENIDGIAGATISSKGVTAGVNQALEIPIRLESIASELSYKLWSDTEEESSETESETQAPPTEKVTLDTGKKQDTNISPENVGAEAQTPANYSEDNSYTATREQGYYIEKETTDTEEETSSEEDSSAETTAG